MKEIEIKYLSDNAVKPTRAYGNSAGLDIYASEPAIIRPQDQILLLCWFTHFKKWRK